MKLKQALKELDVPDDMGVYTHIYGKDDFKSEPTIASDISKDLLKKEVLLVQPNHGGQEHSYCHYMFILK